MIFHLIGHPFLSVGLGESYLFRRQFEEAQALLRAQDDWCDAAVRINKSSGADKPVNEETFTRLTERFPESIKLESLVALLRKQVKLNVHCYLPHDLEAMVDHSLEFDFEIAAFHHALSAWQVPDIIKRAKTNITIATFGGKKKARHIPTLHSSCVCLPSRNRHVGLQGNVVLPHQGYRSLTIQYIR